MISPESCERSGCCSCKKKRITFSEPEDAVSNFRQKWSEGNTISGVIIGNTISGPHLRSGVKVIRIREKSALTSHSFFAIKVI